MDLDGRDKTLPTYTRHRENYNLAAEVNQLYIQDNIPDDDIEPAVVQEGNNRQKPAGKDKATNVTSGGNGIGKKGVGQRFRRWFMAVSDLIRRI